MRIAEFPHHPVSSLPATGSSATARSAPTLCNVAALELIDEGGQVGLGFAQSLFQPLPAHAEIVRVFDGRGLAGSAGQSPLALVHRVDRPRGGNQRAFTLPFEEALQVALVGPRGQAGGPAAASISGQHAQPGARLCVRAGFPPNDDDSGHSSRTPMRLATAPSRSRSGTPTSSATCHRLELLTKTVRPGAQFMIDANEAWGAKEALVKLEAIRKAGFDLLWVEDPILRDDFEGLRLLRKQHPWTLINSGEYLDAAGKRQLMLAGATDMLNVHGM